MGSLAQAVKALFEPASNHRLVGAELEMLVYHQEDLHRPVGIEQSSAALAADRGLIADGNVTFEPGGQLELSPSPDADPERLVKRLGDLYGRTERALARAGLMPVLLGTDSWRTNDAVGLQKRSDRYVRMQDHFDRIGPWGRRMMRQTAGLQVCVSLEPGAAGREQWVVANLMAPVLQAMFANSPALEDRLTGLASTRSAVWQLVDRTRTGFSDYCFDGDPAFGYLRFAAGAARIPIIGPAGSDQTHLSTLFPPVRPRGDYIELRCLDAVSLDRVGTAIRLASRLLQDPDRRAVALTLLRAARLDMRTAWNRAARHGMADAGLAALAAGLVDIAGLERTPEVAA